MTPDQYVERVRALVRDAKVFLPQSNFRSVHSLVEYGEPVEGIVSLAWLIVNDDGRVPMPLIKLIREYTEGWLEGDDLPSNLDSHGL